jgi:hypothetical protein
MLSVLRVRLPAAGIMHAIHAAYGVEEGEAGNADAALPLLRAGAP